MTLTPTGLTKASDGSIRDEKGRFVKGFSGNPGGKPALKESLQTIIMRETDDLKVLVEWAVNAFQDSETTTAQKIKIMEMFLDRAVGRPKQAIDLEKKELRIVLTDKDNNGSDDDDIIDVDAI